MNYYQFHIGDYAAHTRSLSLHEDLAYRRLLDAYYLAERPFSGSSADVAREIGMAGCLKDVEYILGRFFERDGDAWSNKRADSEIAKFHGKIEQASRAGRASAERRSNARSTPVDKNPTDVQPTKNQEPRTNNQGIQGEAPRKRVATAQGLTLRDRPDDVSEQTWSDWMALRRAKRAPVTQTVVGVARGEAGKAGMLLDAFLQVWCMRGSQGLQADWLKPDEIKTASRVQPKTFRERDRDAAMERWEQATGQRHPDRSQDQPPGLVVDVAASTRQALE